mgnify:CR=1 FL=1
MKEKAYTLLMEQILSFMERFKFLDKAIESLCKRLGKATSISGTEFSELMKLYNITGSMYLKSLELLDSIICRFPQEITPDELELLEEYRSLQEHEKFIYKSRLKQRK